MRHAALAASVVASVTVFLAIAAPAGAADLPTFKPAEMKALESSGWSAPASEEGKQFRSAAAGKNSVLTVPTWWGKDARPPENTVYVLKVTYKDTLDKPAIFLAQGGHGSYWGITEVHRFGGQGDGKWKVADLPLSWDLIMRKLGSADLTDIAFLADKDLPIESIQVTMAGPDAAEKYFTETRAWVAKAQAAKRAGASGGAQQQPDLPEAMKNQAVVPFARTYLTEVMPNSAPQKGEAGAPLKIQMARNEYEPAAFGIYANGKALQNATFTVTDLSGPGGKLDCETDCKMAEYSVVSAGTPKPGEAPKYRLYPQRFWPAYKADVAAGASQWCLLTVRTLGEKSAPGKYTGRVKITSDAGSAELPVEVEVLPITLLTMQEANLELGGCGFPTLQEMRDLVAHNHTGMDLWFGGTQQSNLKVANGKLSMDFYYINDWMQYCAKLGCTHMFWFGGGDPYGFPDTINLERDLYCAAGADRQAMRREYIAKLNQDPKKVLPETRDIYVQWVRQTAEYAEKNNWPGKLIIHPFDEPCKYDRTSKWENKFAEVLGTGPWIEDHFNDAAALIREGGKGHTNILVGGDMHHAKPSEAFIKAKSVDVFCTNAIHEDQQLGDKVRAAGIQFWQYSGTGDATPAHRPRYTFGFYFGAYDSVGFLVWAYNMGGRFDTSEGGNWVYGWYTPFGTAITPFMIGIREGMDDRRWIETYKKKVGAEKAQELLAPIFQEVIAQRGAGGTSTVTDFWDEVKRLEKVDEWRNKIIEAMLK